MIFGPCPYEDCGVTLYVSVLHGIDKELVGETATCPVCYRKFVIDSTGMGVKLANRAEGETT